MRLLLSLAALMASVVFLQLHSGALGPLDALSGLQSGFSTTQIGLLGSAHFLGFFLGCWSAPRLMGAVGHVRTFAAFAATGTIAAIAHPMLIDPTAWVFMRVGSGLCVAGCYSVVEAWFHAKVTNETRGRVLGTYRFIDLGASLAAQLLIGLLPPAAYVSYNALAILCCAALLPLLLTTAKPPSAPKAPRLRPLKAIRLSPLAALAVVVAGVTMPAFRMVGAVYAERLGLSPTQIGTFLAAAVLGGALVQFPAGWLADKIDRRTALLIASIASILVCGTIGLVDPATPTLAYTAAFAFGVATMPVFSIASAHANDFASEDFIVELSAALLFLFAVGAIFSPLIAARLMSLHGPGAMFAMISAAHGVLCIFGLWRMTVRPAAIKTAYSYIPRTSFLLGRLTRRR